MAKEAAFPMRIFETTYSTVVEFKKGTAIKMSSSGKDFYFFLLLK